MPDPDAYTPDDHTLAALLHRRPELAGLTAVADIRAEQVGAA